MLALSEAIKPVTFLQRARRFSSGLVSLRYLAVRSGTAGGAVIAGFVHTFVFARVLDPHRFSLFALVGAMGITIWLLDLGLTKILFVRLRSRYLNGDDTLPVAAQASAICVLYATLVTIGAIVCSATTALALDLSAWPATEFGLFFFFSAINLVWFVFRNVSVAVDEYIFFEAIDAFRRISYIALLLATLVGLPFAAFVIIINVKWAVLFAVVGTRLVRRRALAIGHGGLLHHLRQFVHENGKVSLRTSMHAAAEIYFCYVLYLVIPIAFGLGAPTIVVDSSLKFFFGAAGICAAASDLLLPRQTAAFANHDAKTLLGATLTAIALCAVPTIVISALLMFDAKTLFALLLGKSATMPVAMTPVLIVLMLATAVKMPAAHLLQHTGFFHEISRVSVFTAALLTVALAIGVFAGLDIVGILAIYTGTFVVNALLFLILALRGPIHAAKIAKAPEAACAAS